MPALTVTLRVGGIVPPPLFKRCEKPVALDAGTLTTTLAVVSAVLAGLLALTWLQNRGMAVAGEWTLSFVLCALAAILVAARGAFPDFFALDAANVLRLSAFGLAWHAARHFCGQRGSWALAMAPAVLWIAAALLLFGEEYRPRILMSAPLLAAYSLAVAAELWRAPSRTSLARAASGVLLVHAAFMIVRFLFALGMTEAEVPGTLAHPLHPLALVETMVVAISLAFLLLSGVREQVTMLYQEAALLDPLTGVGNRRGFDAEAKRMLARARRDGTSTALLLLDLDHFKALNDRFGHLAGDRALKAFARTVAAELREGDLLGRLGGEEFAVALADCRTDQAARLAERIRRATAALALSEGGAEIRLTVSIGVASLRAAESLDALLTKADAALYRAKAGGRDRVETPPVAVAADAAGHGEDPELLARVAFAYERP
jgi:diguanylate cyclase (GGDEF)-like protein